MYFGRYLTNIFSPGQIQKRVYLILGARQTGKTTLFKLLEESDYLLLDFQERNERIRFSQDPALLTRTLLAKDKGYQRVLVDEIQRVPELLEEIQLIVDRYPERFTFILTGSSARRLRRGSANLLPGRARLYWLFPIILWEMAGTESLILSLPEAPLGQRFPMRELEELLVLGCLPGIWNRMDRRDLESYVALYLEEEIQREAIVRKLGPFGRFLRLAAIESGQSVNLTKISQESGISLSTLRGFYSVLEDTLVGFTLLPFSSSARVRLLKTPKFYFFDVGVRNAVAELPLERDILATQAGHLFEHWVGCELFARLRYLGQGFNLYYWRTVGGAEVDFIIETPKEIIPIEVKFTANPRPQDASAIEHFIGLYSNLSQRGFIICRNNRPEQLSEHVQAIPWDKM